MANHLLIVESPAKSKTIGKFLGKDFTVLPSYGHIRDLKTKGMGVDVDNNYDPQYEISDDKKSVVSTLRAAAKKADHIWLASDEDREGEAIAWHLAEVLGLSEKEKNRIVFHEITESAIQNALKNPRSIDLKMVDAQQARRVLDRLVGFELSPILWRKVRPSLSAGRVQSVAVRIIVEREKEIHDFEPESSFRVRGLFTTEGGESLSADLTSRPQSVDEAMRILEDLLSATYSVGQVTVTPATRQPAPPFTTSTLQQEASRRLGYPVGLTMSLAQKLYEAGHITYMRTDSVHLSSFAVGASASVIEREYGKEYVKVRNFATKTKGAQEAHEAIRPVHPEAVSAGATAQERRLYDMIRKRTLATQMADAQLERTTVTIDASSGSSFQAKGEVITFDGFLKVYLEGRDDEDDAEESEEGSGLLPRMAVGDVVSAEQIEARERFTKQPARYTEASLVKKLEDLGIGRPSTYAPTIQTIQKRGYVEKRNLEGEEQRYTVLTLKSGKISRTTRKERVGASKGKLCPTDTGLVVTDYLIEHFPRVMDYHFTAEVEEEFDAIADGEKQWTEVIDNFYRFFHSNVEDVMNEKEDHKVGERYLGDDPKTGLPIYSKIGRYGPMVQMGKADVDGEKPKFASLPKDLSIATITLEQALKLLQLPREIGQYNGDAVTVDIGRFGPYVRVGKSFFVSIPKEISPYEIEMDQATPLIKEKEERDRNKYIAEYGEGSDKLEILNGRYGPYIKYKRKNYKIPKTVEAKSLTEEQARAIVAESTKNGGTTKKRSSASKTKKAASPKKKASGTKSKK